MYQDLPRPSEKITHFDVHLAPLDDYHKIYSLIFGLFPSWLAPSPLSLAPFLFHAVAVVTTQSGKKVRLDFNNDSNRLEQLGVQVISNPATWTLPNCIRSYSFSPLSFATWDDANDVFVKWVNTKYSRIGRNCHHFVDNVSDSLVGVPVLQQKVFDYPGPVFATLVMVIAGSAGFHLDQAKFEGGWFLLNFIRNFTAYCYSSLSGWQLFATTTREFRATVFRFAITERIKKYEKRNKIHGLLAFFLTQLGRSLITTWALEVPYYLQSCIINFFGRSRWVYGLSWAADIAVDISCAALLPIFNED